MTSDGVTRDMSPLFLDNLDQFKGRKGWSSSNTDPSNVFYRRKCRPKQHTDVVGTTIVLYTSDCMEFGVVMLTKDTKKWFYFCSERRSDVS